MNEPEKREKVIKGLECCSGDYALCTTCYLENSGTCRDTLMKDAIELLKAQDARVLALEEVRKSDRPVYIEGGELGGQWAIVAGKPRCTNVLLETVIEFLANGLTSDRIAFSVAEYGITWRCWSEKPTYARRQVVKWG